MVSTRGPRGLTQDPTGPPRAPPGAVGYEHGAGHSLDLPADEFIGPIRGTKIHRSNDPIPVVPHKAVAEVSKIGNL